jgi:DNA recombination protein Rad52
MSGFTPKQLRALRHKLDRRHVHNREVESRSIDYVEGWFAISEANAIFGFDGWDREMTHFERLYERNRNDRTSCAYLARVRLRVRAGDCHVIREGTGWGSATAPALGDAHERALKAAETDATKRALATFGNRFGLSLYDKEQNGVTPKRSEPSGFCLHAPDGVALAENLSPEGFCGGLRQLIEKLDTLSELESLHRLNAKSLDRLRKDASALKTNKGVHYADVLERLLSDRSKEIAQRGGSEPLDVVVPLKPSKIAPGPRIDKSALTIGTERRLRDKAHLQFVASHPCLVCARQPCHAHHLTFAQGRGLSLKVSDEFTVPLCAVHHDALHRSGSERSWWHEKGIDPVPIAAELWATSRLVPPAPNLRANGAIPADEVRIAVNGAENSSTQ